ncbi:DinB family protein [Dyadobacter frigoris]|uniref:DinB family protein n=1 Tax=Dyadobacter frigoris TaxID=2576211 RepID=A0A4U6D7J3_9BACT|nr:DinB family protein [Dyadobacter frigoris]TKT93410.1 DinB family protein [Dyadobacter frigoris]GLU54723.1 hypothetical protein Dfri01_41840 [Dyadobacter frigoris]
MEKIAPYILRNRRYILSVVRNLTTEQINDVPRGFNNSIIWNIGHMTAVQLEMYYLMTGNALKVEEKYHVNFRIGTHPFWVEEAEIAVVKHLYLQAVGQLDEDYRAGLFKNYDALASPHPNASALSDITTHFLFHEGLHFNNIMSLRRIILMGEVPIR